MKLRCLLTTATVAALAAVPLAATSTAGAAGFDAHSHRFDDNTEDQHIVGTIDIENVHLYRNTRSDFVAVVTYKDLVRRPATKWIITFSEPILAPRAQRAGDEGPETVAMEYRIGPNNKTAAFGYQVPYFGDTDPKPTKCAGFAARADFAADTITYTIPQTCWTVEFNPAYAEALTRLFTKGEWRSNYASYYEPTKNRSDQAWDFWTWTDADQVDPADGQDLADRNPFYRH